MNDENKNPNLLLVIFALIFLMAVIASVVSGVVFIIHAVRNPELTTTQMFIWYILDTKWWIGNVALIVSYLGMIIEKDK